MLQIDKAEVTVPRRGFHRSSVESQSHIEEIGRSFLFGYHTALKSQNDSALPNELENVEFTYQGFAFEGASMALCLLDGISLTTRHRWREFSEGPAHRHRYVLHVGLGWAVARLPWLRSNPEKFLSTLDPLFKWLVLDGFGFHEGYFRWKKWSPESKRRPQFSGYAARAFDQGLGRSIWFVTCADVVETARTIEAFEPGRQPDLWSGVGLACAYAGKPSVVELEFLMASAQQYLSHLRQGISFGAEAREFAEISTDETELVCMVVCGMSASAVAQLTHTAKNSIPTDSTDIPLYELWRDRIRILLQ